MKFESITLHRIGTNGYQITIWTDGTVRWDGTMGRRMGAWQALVRPDWLDALMDLIIEIPAPKKDRIGAEGSLVLETSQGKRIYGLTQDADPHDTWRLAMLIDGLSGHLSWVPLDVTGASDFSMWANGHWMTFDRGAARGQALALREGLLLLAGSIASPSQTPALEEVYEATRAEMLEDGRLVPVGDVFVLTRHVQFSSPSAPASVLAGSNANGRQAWRDADGASWAELRLD